MQNVRLQIGFDASLNFWIDKWLFHTIIDMLNISHHLHRDLNVEGEDFIYQVLWSFTCKLSLACLLLTVNHVPTSHVK